MPQVVGITVHLTFARRAYRTGGLVSRARSKVILGGLHVLSCPDECAPHADALALGDGVQLWPRILRDVEANRLQPRYVATYENDYCDDPSPRRSILPRRSFLTTTSLIATRGCHNRCGFCYLATDGLRMPYRMRDPAAGGRRVRRPTTSRTPSSSTTISARAATICTRCARRCVRSTRSGARPSRSTSPTIPASSATWRWPDAPACSSASSRSPTTISPIRTRRRRRPADYARRVRILHDYGIQVNGSFVLGFDHDRKDVFARTAEWIEENRLECATFHILTPYPATPLFRQMEAEGRILHRDWTLYDTGHAVFRPKHMTPEELEQGYAWIYQRLFSHASIWRRRPEDWQAVPLYIAMSYLYKRSNRFWHLLIKHDLVNPVWKPLVEMTRWRHVRYRRRLAQRERPSVLPGRSCLRECEAASPSPPLFAHRQCLRGLPRSRVRGARLFESLFQIAYGQHLDNRGLRTGR